MQMSKAFAAISCIAAVILAGCGGGSGPGEGPGSVSQAEKIANEGRAGGPMPDGAFRAVITVTQSPSQMRRGQIETLQVKIKNVGNAAWPSRGRAGDGYYQVNLGNIWFDSQNKRITDHLYRRSYLPGDLQPGQEVEVPLTITAPSNAGDYKLQIDLVQEMVAWFGDKGSKTLDLKVKVE